MLDNLSVLVQAPFINVQLLADGLLISISMPAVVIGQSWAATFSSR